MNNFAFLGTSKFSVIILDDLKNKYGIVPSLLVTVPDMPKGRKHIVTPSEAKVWAVENDVPIYQPEKLKSEEVKEKLKNFDFFLVASYGKIIPDEILNIPKLGALNVHPSLLPKYRGASPIQNQILNSERNVGVSIILMDKEMDHGPIVAQKKVGFNDPHIGTYEDVEEVLAHESAILLNDTLLNWIKRDIKEKEQDHEKATFTEMIEKEDGEIDLDDDSEKNYRKYLAYHHWPKVFFYRDREANPPSQGYVVAKTRNIVTEATFEDNKFKILKIIPEGKKEMVYIPSSS